MVILLGSTDETIIRYVELVEQLTEISGHFICQVAWSSPQLTGPLRHLQPVFVSSGLEAHFAAAEPLKAGQCVRGDRLIGMADVRPSVGIVDRGREIIWLCQAPVPLRRSLRRGIRPMLRQRVRAFRGPASEARTAPISMT